MFIDMIQKVIDGFATIIAMIISVLPPSPFQALFAFTLNSDILSFINWLIPINNMIAITETWITAIGVYYLFSIIMRYVKMIG